MPEVVLMTKEDEEDLLTRLASLRKADGDSSDDKVAAQKKRAAACGISPKEGGHLTCPSEWSSIAGQNTAWGDWTNFRYPMPDASHARNALSRWGDASNRSQYSSEEQGIVGGRIRRRARALGVDVSEESEKSMAPTSTSTRKAVSIDDDGTHDPMTGAHAHKHAAFGHPSADEDGMHPHGHEHADDADHHHEHDGLAAGSGAAAGKGTRPPVTKSPGIGGPENIQPDTLGGDGLDAQGAQRLPQAGPGTSSVPGGDRPADQLGNHAAFVGFHTHAHKAFGYTASARRPGVRKAVGDGSAATDGDDGDVHSHEHYHNGDTHHAHSHVDLGHGSASNAVTHPSPGQTAPVASDANTPPGNSGLTLSPADKVPTPSLGDAAGIGYGGTPANPVASGAGAGTTPGSSAPDFGANVGYGGSPAGPAFQQQVAQSADSPEFQATLLAFNTLAKRLGFPERGADGRIADKTACALVETDQDAQEVIAIVAQLDAYIDGAEECQDRLMQKLGVRDVDSDGDEDGDTDGSSGGGVSGPARNRPYYAVEGMTPDMTKTLQRALAVGLLIKEGRRNNAADRATIQGIHDATYMLTDGVVCKSTIPAGAQPSDEADEDEPADLSGARYMGNQTVGGNPDNHKGLGSRPALLKTMQDFAALLAQFDVKALEGYVTETRKQADVLIRGMTAIDERLRATEEQVERIGNVRLVRPTALTRAFRADPGVANLIEMFGATDDGKKAAANGGGTGNGNNSEFARVKAQTSVERVEGVGPMRRWPAGVGKGMRPELTGDQKSSGMTPATIRAYLEGEEALVPIIDPETD